jgi:hypothetical protein
VAVAGLLGFARKFYLSVQPSVQQLLNDVVHVATFDKTLLLRPE